ncbi:MAG: excinuclease ABC subunit C [Candidatus Cloacimonetes bacterium]|nr:excinuclease ABC subunit C [Candidatus Cloacimonadota bacterium]
MFQFDPGNQPAAPGVYLFRDATGRVLYVGKARDLRTRLRSYARGGDGRTHIPVMLGKAASVETIVTDSEVEALILENTLIKTHRPRYNVVYRDDKTYPYIRITKEDWPRVFITRTVVRDGSRYFGPYTEVGSLRAFLRSMKDRLKLRDCDLAITEKSRAEGRHKVCLDYHIGKCLGPCAGHDDQPDYNRRVETLVRILKGQVSEVRRETQAEMAAAASALRFEDAAAARDTLQVLERFDQGQKVEKGGGSENLDLLALAREDRDACMVVFRVREGRLNGRFHAHLRCELASPDEELLERFLFGYYEESRQIPPRLLLPLEPGDPDLLSGFLQELRGRSTRLEWPQRGEKASLMRMAEANARHLLAELKLERLKRDRVPETLQALARDLDLPGPPTRIEGFDISHFGGEGTVASLVVFEGGKPLKKDYRIFNIRETQGIDDFASMEEVVRRRYTRVLAEERPLPDLVLIDGGKGQLGRAHAVLQELGLASLPVIGLAKRFEEVFLPGESLPRNIPKVSASNRLLQHIRNEAHRFAIGHNRSRLSRERKMDFLEDVPGLGPTLRDRLLAHFGSLKKLRTASLEDLCAVRGISAAKAQAILEVAAQQ